VECYELTLVLLVPHRQGFVLIADRQNTRENGYKDEFTKLYLQSDQGPAIGCAGSTEIIKALYGEIKASADITNNNICEKIKEIQTNILPDILKTASLIGPGLLSGKLTLEIFVIKAEAGNVVPLYMQGFCVRKINASKINAIPEESPNVRRYLDIDTNTFSEKKAILVGYEVLRQAVLSNYKIGPPEYHGYDLIKVRRNGEFTSITQAGLQEMSVSELLNHLNKRTEIEEEE